MWRAFVIAAQAIKADNLFAAYLSYGIGIWFGLQSFINIGVNMGLLPTKGLTLPLMSYGGSSMVVMCAAVALLLRVDHETRCTAAGLSASGSAAAKRRRRGRMMAASATRPVLIMAGGTGGHVFPALAVAEELVARGVAVSWLGTRRGLEARVVPAAGYPLETMRVSGLRGKGVMRLLLAPFMLLIALLQALVILLRLRPRAVLGMGGFASGPGGLIAWLLRRPLLIHEQNSVAGMTNRWLAPLARTVMEAFPGSMPAKYRPLHTGNPVRREITRLPEPAERLAQRQGALRVLVIGGSLGAHALNTTVPAAMARLSSGNSLQRAPPDRQGGRCCCAAGLRDGRYRCAGQRIHR